MWNPFPPELEVLFFGEYWGPGTDLSIAGDPISDLDRLSRDHDIAYSRAGSGRTGRFQRMEADARMAKDAGGITGVWMTVQSGVRLLTMNLVPLPWD